MRNSLDKEQVEAIAKYTRNICLLYDNDTAGRNATARNADMITKMGLTALILSIPDMEDGSKQDPDTYFTSKVQFANFYNNCKVNYLVSIARSKADNCVNDPDYKSKTIKEICAMIFNRPANEQASIIEELSAVIPSKSLWNKTMKELHGEAKEAEKEKASKDRTAVQNETYTKYGFYEKEHCYWFHNPKGEGMFEGSNFVMEPLFHIESTINAKRMYRITNTFGITSVVEFPQKDLISLAAFKLRCESLGNFLFNGGEYGLAKIKSYLYEKTQTCKEITQMAGSARDSLRGPTVSFPMERSSPLRMTVYAYTRVRTSIFPPCPVSTDPTIHSICSSESSAIRTEPLPCTNGSTFSPRCIRTTPLSDSATT